MYSREDFVTSIALNSGLGKRYAGIKMENFIVKYPFQEEIKNKLKLIVNDYNNSKDNFVFTGDKGTGKTYAAALLAQELYVKNEIDNFSYITLHSYMSKIKHLFSSENRDSTEFSINDYLHTDFLILDEFGSYPLTQYDYQLLFDLVDERYSNNLKTCFISNLKKPSEITDFMHSAISDRVFESVDLVNFGSVSLRSKGIGSVVRSI